MRQPIVISANNSPLAETFSKLALAYANGPTPEERAYKEAVAAKYGAEAVNEQRQAEALQNVGGNLQQIFGQYTSNGVPKQEFVGPAPEEGLQMESPEQRGTRLQTGLADIYARVGKDNAAALRSGLETGLAYGAPDDMRRSMVLQGKSIDEDFSPTAAEGNRVATRNADSTIRVNNAKPDMSVTPRNYVTPDGKQGFTLDGKTDGANGAAIPQGSQIFTGQVNTDSASKLPGGVVASAVGNTDAANAALSTLDELVKIAKPENFGLVGQARGFMQGVGGQVNALASWGANRRDTIAQAIEANPEAFQGFNFSEFFDDSLPQQDLLANTLAYEYAKTLDSDGRLSNEDVKNARAMLGMTGMFSSMEAFNAREPLIRKRITGMRDRNAARLPAGAAAPTAGGGAMPAAGAPAAVTPPAAGGSVVEQSLANARAKIARNPAARDEVLKRLQAAGIAVPPDL